MSVPLKPFQKEKRSIVTTFSLLNINVMIQSNPRKLFPLTQLRNLLLQEMRVTVSGNRVTSIFFSQSLYLIVNHPFCHLSICPIRYLSRILQQFSSGSLLLVQPIFSKPPWGLWLRDLSNSIVTLGNPSLNLDPFRHIRPTQAPQAHLGTLGTTIGPLRPVQAPQVHLDTLRPTQAPPQAHLGTLGLIQAHFDFFQAHLGMTSICLIFLFYLLI